jgi:hypothetical protein
MDNTKIKIVGVESLSIPAGKTKPIGLLIKDPEKTIYNDLKKSLDDGKVVIIKSAAVA